MSQKIRIKLKSYDYSLVDKSAEKIVKTVKATGAVVSGPIPLPTHKRIFTVNRSTFVNKKSREQFELSSYKRLIDIYSSTAKTVDALMKLDEETLLAVFEGVPHFEVSRDELASGVKVIDLCTEKAPIFPSKGEMRKLVQSGGVSLNKEKLTETDAVIDGSSLLNGKYLLVQRGKKSYYLLIVK